MLRTDREGLYGYVIEYILDKDHPRLKKDNGEPYKKGDWFPYHHVLFPLHDEDKPELIDKWYKNLLEIKKISNKDEMRIRPIYCYFSSDDDFEYVGNEENDYLKG